jgi:hypothetical protein
MVSKVGRPDENESAPFYSGYIQYVPDGDIFEILARQHDTLRAMLTTLPSEQADFRPGPAEWSIKEVVGHINDVERVFAYRALRISRGDQTPLPGFEQDDYVREANFGERTLPDLLEEFELLRRANLLAFNRLSSRRVGARYGKRIGVSVRALIYMMAGHGAPHGELAQSYLARAIGGKHLRGQSTSLTAMVADGFAHSMILSAMHYQRTHSHGDLLLEAYGDPETTVRTVPGDWVRADHAGYRV